MQFVKVVGPLEPARFQRLFNNYFIKNKNTELEKHVLELSFQGVFLLCETLEINSILTNTFVIQSLGDENNIIRLILK